MVKYFFKKSWLTKKRRKSYDTWKIMVHGKHGNNGLKWVNNEIYEE